MIGLPSWLQTCQIFVERNSSAPCVNAFISLARQCLLHAFLFTQVLAQRCVNK